MSIEPRIAALMHRARAEAYEEAAAILEANATEVRDAVAALTRLAAHHRALESLGKDQAVWGRQ